MPVTRVTDDIRRDDVLWRYMSFIQLIDLLQTRELFLPRLCSLEDPFEGTFDAVARKEFENMKLSASDSERRIRERVCVSCWHQNEGESAAMWAIYSKAAGIAVQTTVASLALALDADKERFVQIERVGYGISRRDGPFICKRKSFEHEREVRVLALDPDVEKMPAGIRVQVDVATLIGAVFVDPRAEGWTVNVINTSLNRLGLPVIAKRSDLYSRSLI